MENRNVSERSAETIRVRENVYHSTRDRITEGQHFGHIAFEVENIDDVCQRLMEAGITINRPPRDGHMAFVRSPDNVSIELLQKANL